METQEYQNPEAGTTAPRRTIAVIQPYWHNARPGRSDAWTLEQLEKWVADVAATDVAVVPECYPWCTETTRANPPEMVWTHEEHWPLDFAREKLRAIARRHGRTIIAGGVLREGDRLRNALLYASPAHRDVQVYCKRILWDTFEERHFAEWPLSQSTVFRDGDRAIIPLICADVFGPTEATEARRPGMREAVLAAAVDDARRFPGAPILVCAYAGRPTKRGWSDRLQALADAARTNVIFCNFAGNDGSGFGGGGSGVFIPEASPIRLGNDEGVFRYID